MNKKIMVIFGTRPEAIKLAPVIRQINGCRDSLRAVICVSGQHRYLLDQVLKTFDIKPHYDLNIMEENQSLFDIISKGIDKLKIVMSEVGPDMVIVQGDTSTTFLAALTAFYFKIPVGYVEAGLRTSDKYNPFPEEINRRLTSVMTDVYFAPTMSAKYNIMREGVDEKKVFVTGNTAIDALFMVNDHRFDIAQNLKISRDKKIILVTAHRREKFGGPFQQMCYALREIVKKNEDVELVYPLHLNPYVQTTAQRILKDVKRIHLIKPLDYSAFVQLMKKAYLIITDSGGIQEESPSLGKPVVVIRKVTERPEGVEAKSAIIAGEDKNRIVKIVCGILNDKILYKEMSIVRNIYGDGRASHRIVKLILHFFKLGNKPKEFVFRTN